MPCSLHRVAAAGDVDDTCEFEVWFPAPPNGIALSRGRHMLG
jgi:hypothetical protein